MEEEEEGGVRHSPLGRRPPASPVMREAVSAMLQGQMNR